MLAVVAASGLMSVLPGQSQVAVSRFACRVASLGLGACGAAGVDLQNAGLNPPRCTALATLDSSIPEVRVNHLSTRDGLPVTISSARSGDVWVQLGPDDDAAPPFLLDGGSRPSLNVVPGVQLPSSVEWFLPSGQGLDDLVAAVHDRHQQWVQRRSALAVLTAARSRADRQIPSPTVLVSQVRLGEPVLPTYPNQPAVPRSGSEPPPRPVPSAPVNAVSIVPGSTAVTVINRVTRELSTVAPVAGVLNATAVTGTLRWTRDATGGVTSVVLAVVSPGALVQGELIGPGTSTGVAYISVPVRTAPERVLAQRWLSDSRGFSLQLDELLGLRRADPDDQLVSFLTRAAQVTTLRYAGIEPEQTQRRVASELTTLRRVDWPGTQLVAASTIAPAPDGSPRSVLLDPQCASR